MTSKTDKMVRTSLKKAAHATGVSIRALQRLLVLRYLNNLTKSLIEGK